MEIEQFSYIFGSFSRRKQNQDFNASKRRSVESSKPSLTIAHDRSKSNPAKSETNASLDIDKLKCPQCEKHFIEPRVLPCLHTFCTNCLQNLVTSSPSECDSSSGSGYVSEKLESIDMYADSVQYIPCPLCRTRADVPDDGVQGFPINYLILHRMVLATLNSPSTKLLCDACPLEVNAKTRCTQCALSLCRQCADAHSKQKAGWNHEILELDEARRRGISKVRRQVMCQKHPENELTTFCATCSQVVCADCVNSAHRSHTLESPSKAAKTQTTNIRIAVNRAKSIADKSMVANSRLQTTAERIESQCNQIENEIERFTANYIRAVEEHREQLFKQLRQARQEKLNTVDIHRSELQKHFHDAEEAIRFANDLLKEGSEIELLSFVAPVMKRLEVCYKSEALLPELKISESLQFLPEEVSSTSENACCPLYGVITTQTISVKHCVLHTNGLQNLRVGRRAEAVLETRDRSDNALQRGGEQVSAELRHRDGGTSRTLPVHVEDRRDGSYLLQFVPDVAGKLFLHVGVKGESLKESPFTILVRSLRPHHGTFHCCTFCSSGGSKESTCGCKGRMPGGYKGCGHGHEGHPGRRHWSCCGNVLEHSECVRMNSITHYQFTL